MTIGHSSARSAAYRRHHPARADRSSAAVRRSAVAHRELLRADRGRRLRSRRSPGEGQPLDPALECRADAKEVAMSRRLPPPCSPSAVRHGRTSRRSFRRLSHSRRSGPFPRSAASWIKQYDFRFIEGDPDLSGGQKTCRPARSPSCGSVTAFRARSTCFR